MEINIKEIFMRTDMKQIRSFLLDGNGKIDENCYGTYQERLERDSEDIVYALKRAFKGDTDEKRFNEAMDDLSASLFAYRDVFTEIGMKIGARLLFQFLY